MNTDVASEALDQAELTLLERLRSAADLLELIDSDRRLLDRLPAADRDRFHQAVAQIYNPDPVWALRPPGLRQVGHPGRA